MKLIVNGERTEIVTSASVTDLIVLCNLLPEATAVQRNDEIVQRSAYGTTMLEDGDVIELVRFVGGG